MSSSDKTHPMSLECLPTELFLQIFTFLPLGDIVTAFSGLNSYIDSVIQLARGPLSHELKYNDVDALNLLHLFSAQIGRLVIINVEMADFTSLINLRSLTLKYGSKTQFDIVRPEYFPLLEILHIQGFHRTVTNSKETLDNLLQVLLSNGFPRLRTCTTIDMGFSVVNFNNTWTGSFTLRTLNLWMETSCDCEQLRSVCPRLRRLTTSRFSIDEPSTNISLLLARSQIKNPDGTAPGGQKRIFVEIKGLERAETENRIIIDDNPLTQLSDQKVPPRFNNTINTPRSNATGMFTFQARILPQTEPYCRASFLLEIEFPPGYPFKAPEIIFLDPIYHPSIDTSGRHSYNWGLTGDKPYHPKTFLVDIIDNIIRIIDSKPEYSEAVDVQCFAEYQNDYQTFYKKAMELTLSYGRPRF